MLRLWRYLKIPIKLMIGFSVVSLIFLLSSLFTLDKLDELHAAAHKAALVDAPRARLAEKIQSGMFQGHLWLEELLTGDQTLNLDKDIIAVWQAAQNHARILLEGGELENRYFEPMPDQAIQHLLSQLIGQITRISELAKQRAAAQSVSVIAGSKQDQQFDAAFDVAIKHAEQLRKIFTLHSLQSSQDVDRAFNSQRRQLLASMILVICVSILIPLLLAKYIVINPLTILGSSIQKLSNGDFSGQVLMQQHDEFGSLATAFNLMAENLRTIVNKVQNSTVNMASTANDVAAMASQQQASASQQEATANQIVASTKEISATSKELANSMDEVARVVDETASLAEQGRNSLTRMGGTIAQMVEASKDISGKLSVLNERAANITSVVTTINKVADQTNLLSVNAAIEADKAGEHGIGFGTVATEIRRLADQTAVATWDIEEMVKEMQSAVSSGVMAMEKFSEQVYRGVDEVQQVGLQLTTIIEQVQTLGPHFEIVHEGVHSQTEGAQQISDALGQLGEAIRGTVESLRQSNKVIDALHMESAGMREAVSVFRTQT